MTGKIITRITILLLIIIAMTSPALAASAGVSPASIILNGTQGETYKINFAVVNTGNDTTDYFIYARGNITNWTTIPLQSVTLEGKKAYVTNASIAIPEDMPDGTYKGDIIIKSIPDSAGGGNKISIAVNLPVTISISRPAQTPILLIAGIIMAVVIFGLMLREGIKKKGKPASNPEGEFLEDNLLKE